MPRWISMRYVLLFGLCFGVPLHHVKKTVPPFPYKDFAGTYCEDTGRYGTNVTITADGKFIFETQNDVVGPPLRHITGLIHVEGQTLWLMPTRDSLDFDGGWMALVRHLLPVRWGHRHYLVHADKDGMLAFCNAVNTGDEPRQPGPGFPYLRESDEKKPVAGLPQLPKPWSDYLLKKPVSCTVVSDEVSTATVNAGTAEGLKPGMELVLVINQARFVIVKADTHSATITSYSGVPFAINVGNQLSTSKIVPNDPR